MWSLLLHHTLSDPLCVCPLPYLHNHLLCATIQTSQALQTQRNNMAASGATVEGASHIQQIHIGKCFFCCTCLRCPRVLVWEPIYRALLARVDYGRQPSVHEPTCIHL